MRRFDHDDMAASSMICASVQLCRARQCCRLHSHLDLCMQLRHTQNVPPTPATLTVVQQ